jgi:hypothetical protein
VNRWTVGAWIYRRPVDKTASWDANRTHWQTLTNARPIPTRSAQRDIDPPARVRVRLAWEQDGEESRDTTAVAWAGRDFLVRLDDRRVQIQWVWLTRADVERI